MERPKVTTRGMRKANDSAASEAAHQNNINNDANDAQVSGRPSSRSRADPMNAAAGDAGGTAEFGRTALLGSAASWRRGTTFASTMETLAVPRQPCVRGLRRSCCAALAAPTTPEEEEEEGVVVPGGACDVRFDDGDFEVQPFAQKVTECLSSSRVYPTARLVR